MPVLLALGVVAALGLALAVWMVWVEPRWFRVRRVVREAPAAGLRGLRILHLTDTHFHGRDRAILAFLRELAGRGPYDLVLMTGDLIDTPAGVPSLARAAALFEPRLGGFAVLGGHDYRRSSFLDTYRRLLFGGALHGAKRSNPVDRVVEALEQNGFRVLRDECCYVEACGGDFAIVGLRDAFVFTPDLQSAWDGTPEDLPVIAIAHSPDVMPEVCERGADLAFFGHTHGGQVRFPFVGALITRCRMNSRLARGTFERNGTLFVVNNGLGASPVTPYRLLCRPEAVVMELTDEAATVEASDG